MEISFLASVSYSLWNMVILNRGYADIKKGRMRRWWEEISLLVPKPSGSLVAQCFANHSIFQDRNVANLCQERMQEYIRKEETRLLL
jgi:hypothetical protein